MNFCIFIGFLENLGLKWDQFNNGTCGVGCCSACGAWGTGGALGSKRICGFWGGGGFCGAGGPWAPCAVSGAWGPSSSAMILSVLNRFLSFIGYLVCALFEFSYPVVLIKIFFIFVLILVVLKYKYQNLLF